MKEMQNVRKTERKCKQNRKKMQKYTIQKREKKKARKTKTIKRNTEIKMKCKNVNIWEKMKKVETINWQIQKYRKKFRNKNSKQERNA